MATQTTRSIHGLAIGTLAVTWLAASAYGDVFGGWAYTTQRASASASDLTGTTTPPPGTRVTDGLEAGVTLTRAATSPAGVFSSSALTETTSWRSPSVEGLPLLAFGSAGRLEIGATGSFVHIGAATASASVDVTRFFTITSTHDGVRLAGTVMASGTGGAIYAGLSLVRTDVASTIYSFGGDGPRTHTFDETFDLTPGTYEIRLSVSLGIGLSMPGDDSPAGADAHYDFTATAIPAPGLACAALFAGLLGPTRRRR
ncbi:MAG: hypothetical protein IPM33_00960 [Phycisphaerales bacterium]|nr:hypothetical protein [Phycisphaerales bacterium]